MAIHECAQTVVKSAVSHGNLAMTPAPIHNRPLLASTDAPVLYITLMLPAGQNPGSTIRLNMHKGEANSNTRQLPAAEGPYQPCASSGLAAQGQLWLPGVCAELLHASTACCQCTQVSGQTRAVIHTKPGKSDARSAHTMVQTASTVSLCS